MSVSKSVRQTNKTKRKKKVLHSMKKPEKKKSVHDAFYEVLSNVL